MPLLPSMSKIFEYVVFDQLMSFLTDKRLFCIVQFGIQTWPFNRIGCFTVSRPFN